ncbi:MAG: UDP-glucose/GDP-mannose dehydrogenase family protein [Chloroflexi bacterium]|nr:UDP-glucose/GDP-mannose dehydrogenase family protein [Chloroflexota bacterium]
MDLADARGDPAGGGVTAPTGFLGLSHLGIVTGIGWASFGRPVLGVDPDQQVVDRLAAADLPVHEPGLPDLLTRSQRDISFSADLARLAECPLVIVARDVPTDAANRSDLAPVLALVDAAIPHLRQDVVLVVMSQVPPGFTRALGARIAAARPELRFELVYWVETLIFGDAVHRTLEPERFMVGCADPLRPLPSLFEEGLRAYGCPILPMGYESAELTKTAINLYLVGSVTYANTLADLCESIGADWSEMVPALRLDRRIGPAAYIRPGIGIAGGNLERDLVTLQALGREHDVDTSYIDTLITLNSRRFDWVSRKLQQHVFAAIPHPELGVWGLTYKKNTHSTKNSPSLRLIRSLDGRAAVKAWDPVIRAGDVDVAARVVETPEHAAENADALLVMADWDAIAEADLPALRQVMRRPLVIDCTDVLRSRLAEMQGLGIEYISMGRAG